MGFEIRLQFFCLGRGKLHMEDKKAENISYIYTAYITRPDGSRIYAKQYGKKAFRIPVPADKPSK